MKRVVLDTNVLLVAVSKKTIYHAIWQAFLNGEYELCVTSDILDEYAEKFYDKFRPEVGDNVMKVLEESPDIVQINKYYFWNLITADPDDNKFVDCAIAANAHFICTEDKHFNVLKTLPYPIVQVISADDFVETLTGIRHRKET